MMQYHNSPSFFSAEVWSGCCAFAVSIMHNSTTSSSGFSHGPLTLWLLNLCFPYFIISFHCITLRIPPAVIHRYGQLASFSGLFVANRDYSKVFHKNVLHIHYDNRLLIWAFRLECVLVGDPWLYQFLKTKSSQHEQNASASNKNSSCYHRFRYGFKQPPVFQGVLVKHCFFWDAKVYGHCVKWAMILAVGAGLVSFARNDTMWSLDGLAMATTRGSLHLVVEIDDFHPGDERWRFKVPKNRGERQRVSGKIQNTYCISII